MNEHFPDTMDIFILIATGFEEETAVSCMTQLRNAGLPVSMVALSAGPVRGMHGLTISPDKTFADLSKETRARMVIVPGNGQSTNALIMSPRFHHLIHNTLANDGYIVTVRSAENALKNAGISLTPPPEHHIRQGDSDIHEFTAHLVELIT